MNNIKKCSGIMNSNKSKLNSKISWLFNLDPNEPLRLQSNFYHPKKKKKNCNQTLKKWNIFFYIKIKTFVYFGSIIHLSHRWVGPTYHGVYRLPLGGKKNSLVQNNGPYRKKYHLEKKWVCSVTYPFDLGWASA